MCIPSIAMTATNRSWTNWLSKSKYNNSTGQKNHDFCPVLFLLFTVLLEISNGYW